MPTGFQFHHVSGALNEPEKTETTNAETMVRSWDQEASQSGSHFGVQVLFIHRRARNIKAGSAKTAATGKLLNNLKPTG